jgi:hypothetical protein
MQGEPLPTNPGSKAERPADAKRILNDLPSASGVPAGIKYNATWLARYYLQDRGRIDFLLLDAKKLPTSPAATALRSRLEIAENDVQARIHVFVRAIGNPRDLTNGSLLTAIANLAATSTVDQLDSLRQKLADFMFMWQRQRSQIAQFQQELDVLMRAIPKEPPPTSQEYLEWNKAFDYGRTSLQFDEWLRQKRKASMLPQ